MVTAIRSSVAAARAAASRVHALSSRDRDQVFCDSWRSLDSRAELLPAASDHLVLAGIADRKAAPGSLTPSGAPMPGSCPE